MTTVDVIQAFERVANVKTQIEYDALSRELGLTDEIRAQMFANANEVPTDISSSQSLVVMGIYVGLLLAKGES